MTAAKKRTDKKLDQGRKGVLLSLRVSDGSYVFAVYYAMCR